MIFKSSINSNLQSTVNESGLQKLVSAEASQKIANRASLVIKSSIEWSFLDIIRSGTKTPSWIKDRHKAILSTSTLFGSSKAVQWTAYLVIKLGSLPKSNSIGWTDKWTHQQEELHDSSSWVCQDACVRPPENGKCAGLSACCRHDLENNSRWEACKMASLLN